MGFSIADDYDKYVDQLIVLGQKSPLPVSKEANIDATDQSSHPPRTMSLVKKQEECFQ